jgi:ribosomal protein L40E
MLWIIMIVLLVIAVISLSNRVGELERRQNYADGVLRNKVPNLRGPTPAACYRCGAAVPAGAERCPRCREPFLSTLPPATTKTCIQCLEKAPLDAAACPKCGHRFVYAESPDR